MERYGGLPLVCIDSTGYEVKGRWWIKVKLVT